MRGLGRWLARHPLAVGAALVATGVAVYVGWDVAAVYFTPDTPVSQTVPAAPRLVAATSDQTVYRIDPEQSRATYTTQERLAGADREVEGTTRGIAGDLAIDRADPAASQVGEIVVNVEQLTTDNALRDKRIRAEYLESREHPLVRLTDARLSGMPDRIEDGEDYQLTIEADLTVRGVTRPTSWQAEATLRGDTLTASASTQVLMSDFDIGPISIAGLVTTANEVELQLDLVAVDADGFEPPAELAVASEDAGGEGPSFESRIQPLLEQNCASCHTPGGIGADDWTLRTAADAAEVADGLAVVTGAGYMPPWPPSEEGIPLRHPRGLTEEQIDDVRRWADAGAPLDVPDDTPIKEPPETEVPTPDADLVLTSAEAYAGVPEITDDYRCLVFDPRLDQTQFMTGYWFEPDQEEVVHHVIVYRLDAEARERADALSGQDGRPGWQCYGGTGAGRGDMVAGWVPGQRPLDFAADSGFRLDPGDFFVVQMHYHYEDDGIPADRSKFIVELADDPAAITEMNVRTMLAPVELPCASDQDGPLCDRAAAIDDVAERFGVAPSFIPEGLLRGCRVAVEDFAHFTDGTASSSCDRRVGQHAWIVDVLGHMHEIGRSFRMTLNPDTPEEQVLLDIPTWSFAWQLNYQPVKPVAVEPDDVIRIECSWDRSLRYDPIPRYIVFAEGTEDEMCFSTATLLPREADGQGGELLRSDS